MALTFLDTVLEQKSLGPDGDFPMTAGGAALVSARTAVDEGCMHDRNEFYAEVICSLNQCMIEDGCCGDTAKSLVEDEPLARREWKRLLDRVLSGHTAF